MSDHSVVIEIRKYPRSYSRRYSEPKKKNDVRDILTRIARRSSLAKPSEFQSMKYSLPDCEAVPPLSLVGNPALLLPYKKYLKQQKNNINKKRTQMPVTERYMIAATDVKKRRGIGQFKNDVRTILDCDENFYSIVDGRPIIQNVPVYKSLQTAFDRLFRVKYDIGTNEDLAYNFDVLSETELKKYNEALSNVNQQSQQFNLFIADDYEYSRQYLLRWEEVRQKVEKQLNELQNVANEKFAIISRLLSYDHTLRIQQEYGRFLYYVSPPSWRALNRQFARSLEIEKEGFDLGMADNYDSFSVIFEKMVKECGEPVKPVLYFKEPKDLMEVFNRIELQQLNHFTYVAYVRPFVKQLAEGIPVLKECIAVETAPLVGMVESFKSRVEIAEVNYLELQNKFFKILNGAFYECVGTAEILKLGVDLQFVYEQVFGDRPPYPDIVTIARHLELYYVKLMNDLDKFHGVGLKEAINKCMEADKEKMKNAMDAARELRNFSRLQKNLLKAFAEPLERSVRRADDATKPPTYRGITKKQKSPTPEKVLTEAEKDYLIFFTEWTKDEDPQKYLADWNGID